MQTAQRPPQAGKKQSRTGDLSSLLSTRGGLVAIALFTALAAGGILMVFLDHYKNSVNDKTTKTVLVAKSVIPTGSSGDVIADQNLYQTSRATGKQVQKGAITSPAMLHGKVTADTIYPGQQITSADLTTGTNAITSKIAGDQRAISIPLDAAHGMIGAIKPGDHVDVYAGFNEDATGTGRVGAVLKVLLQDVEVLQVPAAPKQGAGAQQTQNVVLRAPNDMAPQFAFSSDVGKVWIVARPPAGARDNRPSLVTEQSILTGLKPIGGGR